MPFLKPATVEQIEHTGETAGALFWGEYSSKETGCA